MTWGVSATGFSRPTLAELVTQLEDGWRDIFGPDVDMSPSTPDGQIIGLFAGALDEAWQASADSYSSFRPSQANGVALADLSMLNGVSRKLGTPSEITLSPALKAPAATIIFDEDFRVQSSAGVMYRTDDHTPIADAGNVLFKSVENGPDIVPATDTWTIVTPRATLLSMSNALTTSTIGALNESDGVLRARREASTEGGATNTLDALYAAVLQVAGVTRARIYVNDTNATVDGRPAHSYEVVVVGGADADVAAAIWGRHPAGIELFGVTTVVHVDSQGTNQDIKFTRPTQVDIFVEVTLAIDSSYPATGDDDIKQAIVDYAAGLLVSGEEFGIGDDVLLTRLYVPINATQGHNVTLLEIGDPIPGGADIVIDETEVANFAVGNITVTS